MPVAAQPVRPKIEPGLSAKNWQSTSIELARWSTQAESFAAKIPFFWRADDIFVHACVGRQDVLAYPHPITGAIVSRVVCRLEGGASNRTIAISIELDESSIRTVRRWVFVTSCPQVCVRVGDEILAEREITIAAARARARATSADSVTATETLVTCACVAADLPACSALSGRRTIAAGS